MDDLKIGWGVSGENDCTAEFASFAAMIEDEEVEEGAAATAATAAVEAAVETAEGVAERVGVAMRWPAITARRHSSEGHTQMLPVLSTPPLALEKFDELLMVEDSEEEDEEEEEEDNGMELASSFKVTD